MFIKRAIHLRSFDNKRYYFYAHLRRNYPYAKNIYTGKRVNAGDVIGYVGRTGYSRVENTNNIEISHLHIGVQLIFDESQKEGTNQIWINFYELSKLLLKNKAEVERVGDGKEFRRKYEFYEWPCFKA